MTTTNEMLAQLNELRTAANMKPLKAWKESRAKLEAAIATLSLQAQIDAKFEASQSEIDAQQTRKDIQDAKHTLDMNALPEVKKSASQKSTPAKRSFSMAKVLNELGFTTLAQVKVARAKLRRNNVAKTPTAIKAFFKK